MKNKFLLSYYHQQELKRQKNTLNLIASENYPSPKVLFYSGSLLMNKYAEGYPGNRYYQGCKYVDKIENLAIELVKELFGAEHANVQPHSGAQANQAVYLALLKPGDTILSLDLLAGGHLTHGAKVNFSGSIYKVYHYNLDPRTQRLDYEQIRKKAHEVKPPARRGPPPLQTFPFGSKLRFPHPSEYPHLNRIPDRPPGPFPREAP